MAQGLARGRHWPFDVISADRAGTRRDRRRDRMRPLPAGDDVEVADAVAAGTVRQPEDRISGIEDYRPEFIVRLHRFFPRASDPALHTHMLVSAWDVPRPSASADRGNLSGTGRFRVGPRPCRLGAFAGGCAPASTVRAESHCASGRNLAAGGLCGGVSWSRISGGTGVTPAPSEC
jgi:hypothetical protein